MRFSIYLLIAGICLFLFALPAFAQDEEQEEGIFAEDVHFDEEAEEVTTVDFDFDFTGNFAAGIGGGSGSSGERNLAPFIGGVKYASKNFELGVDVHFTLATGDDVDDNQLAHTWLAYKYPFMDEPESDNGFYVGAGVGNIIREEAEYGTGISAVVLAGFVMEPFEFEAKVGFYDPEIISGVVYYRF